MEEHLIIETQVLKKIYGMGDIKVHALDGVDVQIHKGEFVSIMGPSGSGKSTLMNILGCLDRPSEGQYYLDGEDVSNLNREQRALLRNRRLGFIFQSYNLLQRTSALDNVMLPLLYGKNGQHLNMAQREEKVVAMLRLVGLEDRVKHHPKELSGGQQQRVAIARALVNEPVLILADEPTGNLDTQSSKEIMGLLHQLHEQGRTIVMVTHDSEVAEHSERIIFIRDGKIESDRMTKRKQEESSHESV